MKHLTAAQRGNIETLLQEKYTNKDIAKKLGRNSSSIGREIAKGLDRLAADNRIKIKSFSFNRFGKIEVNLVRHYPDDSSHDEY